MQAGEFQTLRERALAREPVPLSLYRLAGLLERMPPEQIGRLADDLDALHELCIAAGVTYMSIQAVVDAGLLTDADVWGAFSMVPPERGPM